MRLLTKVGEITTDITNAVVQVTKLTVVVGIIAFLAVMLMGGLCLAAVLAIVLRILQKLSPFEKDQTWNQY